MIFGLAPKRSPAYDVSWPTSSNAMTASTSSPMTATILAPERNGDVGIRPVEVEPTPKRSPRGSAPNDRGARERPTSALTVEQFLLEVWLPRRRRELRPSTARRYQWYVDNYITPAIGAHRLAGLRAEHLDRMYNDLLAHGGRDGGALSAKTVYDVHVVMRSSLRFAVDRHLVDHNVAADARPPRISTRSRPSPEIWTAQQLASFLAHTAHLRLYPAIHLAATTGMRRGEIAGLRWGDWHVDTHRLSVRA